MADSGFWKTDARIDADVAHCNSYHLVVTPMDGGEFGWWVSDYDGGDAVKFFATGFAISRCKARADAEAAARRLTPGPISRRSILW